MPTLRAASQLCFRLMHIFRGRARGSCVMHFGRIKTLDIADSCGAYPPGSPNVCRRSASMSEGLRSGEMCASRDGEEQRWRGTTAARSRGARARRGTPADLSPPAMRPSEDPASAVRASPAGDPARRPRRRSRRPRRPRRPPSTACVRSGFRGRSRGPACR